ncbi:TauD/TfdA family dioxygenase [Amycolatopsis sp.]|uniref:TauD/TfdA family dioxygenase n=1 Tax=Amycolatopsis sp. TaxID=37632 RepID=UPI002D7F625C|nr:TauD/TfdA family dioxygenase [Amycolatopsis sp.]HET6711242.1 TauD/TfdA family dioxygenase [Amycolatopsis sp.]
MTVPSSAGEAFRAIVADRVARGATGDTVLREPSWRLPDAVATALTDSATLPAGAGWRVLPGVLGGLREPGPTPRRWSEAGAAETATHDVALALLATVLGRPFGWAHQQAGRLVHNILPSPESATGQVGASSSVPLEWHTEDAFHPERADYLILACVRNPDRIGTRLASVRDLGLSAHDIEVLGRPALAITPDDSYGAWQNPATAVGMPTVWQRADGLCVRYDPSYSHPLGADPEFAAAYGELAAGFERCGFEVPLSPGDVVVVDNDVMVHGRVAFSARYDGTDRWLKRVLVRSPRERHPAENAEHGYGQRILVPGGSGK